MLTKQSRGTLLVWCSVLLSMGFLWSSAVLAQASPCKSDKDCKVDEVCETPAFQCRKAICPPVCTTDQDCRFCGNSRTRCEPKRKHCVVPPTTGSPCQTDAECRQGEICNPNGRCEVGKSVCSRDSDCQTGQVCNSKGFCAPPAPRKCTQDSDCQPGEFCPKGTCYRPPTQCKSDADCDAGLICNSRRICALPSRPRCQRDKDCQSNEYCSIKNYCERKFVGCPARCRADSDCQRCPFKKLSCHPTKRACVVSTACKLHSDCLAGQRCSSGRCVLKQPLEPVSEPVQEPSVEPVRELSSEPQTDKRELVTTEPVSEPSTSDAAEPALLDTAPSEPALEHNPVVERQTEPSSPAPDVRVEKPADNAVSEKKEGASSRGDCGCSTTEGMPLSLFVLLLLGWKRRRS